MPRLCKYLLASAAALFMAGGALAQTTGSIEGSIVDENGQALPGVTVEATSPNLQGAKIAVSDTGGKFRLVLLPPGNYTVRCSLTGFATTEQNGVVVGLGRVVTLQVRMQSAFKETVVVSGAPPTIDVRSTDIGTNITSQAFQELPLLRNYNSIALITPGTNLQANPQCPNCVSVYGSTGAENAYYIDGVNTTGVRYGQVGKTLNTEFIQEMQVKTGGYQAEYGRATGGVINVITKSGGNEFHGDVFGYYDNSKLQNKVSSAVANYNFNGPNSNFQRDYDRKDSGFDVGGYLMKDKLWFFGAYDYVDNKSVLQVTRDYSAVGGPTAGQLYTREERQDLWSGKLTWRINENHSLILSAFGDPDSTTGPGPNRGLAGAPTTFLETYKQGGTDGALKYEGVLGANFVVNANVTQHKDQQVESGAGLTIPQVRDYTSPIYQATGSLPLSGGLGFANANRFTRDDYQASLSYFLNNFGGDHEFKIGGEYEHIKVSAANYHSGGDLLRLRCLPGFQTPDGCPTEDQYYQHEVYLNAFPPGGYGDPNFADYIINPQTVNSKTNNVAVYLQDTWKLAQNLTLDLGVRYEDQKLYNLFQTVSADVKNEWSPRVGFVWDPSGNGSAKVYGSYGRFYETIPMDMVIRAFGGEISTLMSNQSATDPACDTAFAAQYGLTCRIVGPQSINDLEPVDPNLKGQYIDEIVLGGEKEVAKDLVVGVKGIYRSLGRVIEDSLATNFNYYIGNPSEGLLKQTVDESYTYFFPAPRPSRYFRGIEVDAKKRFSNHWQLIASYLYSKLEGRYDGTFQVSTGQLDPNINSAYDYAEFQLHNYGPLSADRRHQVKVDASYTFDFGLVAGLDAYYRSGTPITAFGYDESYRNWEYYLSNRGSFGTTPSEYEANLHLGYPLKVSGVEINFLVDVFNLLDRQGVTGVDQRYDLTQVINVIDYDTGKALPAIAPGTTCDSVVGGPPGGNGCNPSFGKANAWQPPRSIRLGVRLTF